MIFTPASVDWDHTGYGVHWPRQIRIATPTGAAYAEFWFQVNRKMKLNMNAPIDPSGRLRCANFTPSPAG
jgi:hypothetical protein